MSKRRVNTRLLCITWQIYAENTPDPYKKNTNHVMHPAHKLK